MTDRDTRHTEGADENGYYPYPHTNPATGVEHLITQAHEQATGCTFDDLDHHAQAENVREARGDRIVYTAASLQAKGDPIADRLVLGSLGHPGYSEDEATQVLRRWVEDATPLGDVVRFVTGAPGEIVTG